MITFRSILLSESLQGESELNTTQVMPEGTLFELNNMHSTVNRVFIGTDSYDGDREIQVSISIKELEYILAMARRNNFD